MNLWNGGKALTNASSTQEIDRVQVEQEKTKKLMDLYRIQGCLEALKQLGQVVEIFVNVSDCVAFVWGPMKFLLLVSLSSVIFFRPMLMTSRQRATLQTPSRPYLMHTNISERLCRFLEATKIYSVIVLLCAML